MINVTFFKSLFIYLLAPFYATGAISKNYIENLEAKLRRKYLLISKDIKGNQFNL